MFSKVYSSTVLGIDGATISVESDINDGLPMFTMVGYLSSSVREAAERVRTALKNSGYHMPPKRITINLSPADVKKEGSGFDLPIAIAVLLSIGITSVIDIDKTVIVGELGLNGEVKPINGVLPIVYHASEEGFERCIVPFDNANEASLVKNMEVIAVKNLVEVADYIQGFSEIEPYVMDEADISDKEYKIDFSEIKGQRYVKRGMEIAVSGFHNVIMTGVAGAGKSMIAKRLPTIMPGMSFEESMEVTKIYSVSGLLENDKSLMQTRPFRSPHHTVSNYALVGGGSFPKPGEVTLAHNGVLFLDELPEFNKNVLEVLRQPIEDRKITISRVYATYCFPADFMLVAAMNPCPCGNYPSKKCTCTPNMIKRYQGKISGPLLDRIDINMEIFPVSYDDIFEVSNEESSASIRHRVEEARLIQKMRYKDENICFNSQLEGDLVKKYIILGNAEEDFLKDYYKRTGLSARAVYRILKLSRTIADVEKSDEIKISHIKEAVFYRNTGNYYYGNGDV